MRNLKEGRIRDAVGRGRRFRGAAAPGIQAGRGIKRTQREREREREREMQLPCQAYQSLTLKHFPQLTRIMRRENALGICKARTALKKLQTGRASYRAPMG
jgi:hypothetical protein